MRLLIFLLLTAVLSIDGHTQVRKDSSILTPRQKMTTPELNFAQKLFTSFQQNDEALWLSIQPTEQEYKDLLQLMLTSKVEGLTQDKIDEMMARRSREVLPAYKKKFHDFRATGDMAGVDWKTAVFQRAETAAVYPDEFPKQYLNVTIWLESRSAHFVIEDIQAVEMEGLFKLQTAGNIRKVD